MKFILIKGNPCKLFMVTTMFTIKGLNKVEECFLFEEGTYEECKKAIQILIDKGIIPENVEIVEREEKNEKSQH